jgi:hypothetical protein
MPRCRFCHATLQHVVVDLGMSPLSESYISLEKANAMEAFYPLHVYVCDRCWLVQLEEYVRPDHIFSEYAYFSSYSTSWCEHAAAFTRQITERLSLTRASTVVEVGSNDGYLLQYFAAAGVPVLGIEPAANVASVAQRKGVPTLVKFFGTETARALVRDGVRADLLIGNNVLAQIPDINDCVAGLKLLLATGGVITIEVPHLLRLIEGNQFDTIYHEHFFYFSLVALERIFADHGLIVFDVDELPTHGGSLRVYARHSESAEPCVRPSVKELRERELSVGMATVEYYSTFTEQVHETKRALLEFLISAKRDGKSIAGYGAPGKGNTLLNYCGIRTDFIDYTVDRNPYKHGKLLPGTRLPIFPPERLKDTKPDFVLILPWNLKEEIVAQLSHIQAWGGRCVVPIPRVEVLP